MSRRGWVFGALVLISLLLVSPALAPAGSHVSAQGTIGAPPEWVNFYGINSTFNGQPLPVGSEVVAYAGNKRCGSFIVHTLGQYGVMPCYRDRPEQPGAQPGDRIRFTINGYEAIVRGPDEPIWTMHGDLKHVELEAHGVPQSPTPTPTQTVMPTSTPTSTPIGWSPSPTPTPTWPWTPTPTPILFPTPTPTMWYWPSPTPVTPPATLPPGITCWNQAQDGGFEAGGYWGVDATTRPAARSIAQVHAGSYSMRLGIENEANVASSSAIRQRLEVPANATSALLTLFYYPTTEPDPRGDYWEILLMSPGTNQVIATLWRNPVSNDRRWLQLNVDLSSFRGYAFDLYLNVFNDGLGGRSAVYVDDVVFQICAPAPQVPTPTFTPPPPPATPWTPYPTPAGQCTELISNGGFEAGTQGWYLGPTARVPALVTDNRHSGSYAMRLGIPDGPNVQTFSSIRQTVSIPADAANIEITFWVYLMSTETGGQDHQEFVVLSPADGSTLALPWRVWYDNSRTWMQQRINLTQFRGQSIVVYFNAYNDGAGGVTSMVIDDISLLACRPAPTPSPTAIALLVPTATFTPLPPAAGAAGQQTPVLTLARATPTPSPTPAGLLGGSNTAAIIAAVALIIAILGSVAIIGVVLHNKKPKQSGSASGTYGAGTTPPPPGFGPVSSAGTPPGFSGAPPTSAPPTTSAPGASSGPPAGAGGAAPSSGMPYQRPVRVVSTARTRRISSVEPDVSPHMPVEEEPEEPSEPAEDELGKEEQIDPGAPRRWIQLADKDAPPEEPPAEPAEEEEEDEDQPPW